MAVSYRRIIGMGLSIRSRLSALPATMRGRCSWAGRSEARRHHSRHRCRTGKASVSPWTSRSSGRCARSARRARSSSRPPSSARCWRCCCSPTATRRCRAARLIDVLWGEDPPATAAKALQVHISQLRRALGPEQPIVTRPRATRSTLEPGQLDLERFETLVERARAARGDGRPREAGAAAARGAGALPRPAARRRAAARPGGGRGPTGSPSLRLAALEERLDIELALGRARCGRRRARGARRRAPLPRAGARAADARALPLGPPGGRAGGLPPRAARRWSRSSASTPAASSSSSRRRSSPRIRRSTSTRVPSRRARARRRRRRRCRCRADAAARPRGRRRGGGGAARRPRRPPAHAHRPGRDRQDPAGARAARASSAAFADGARFVPLAAIEDPERVMPAIAQALGAVEPEETALDALRPPAGRSCCSCSTTSSRCSTPRRRSPASSPRHRGLEARGHEPRRRCGSPASRSWRSRRSRAPPRRELFVRRARALNPRLALAADDRSGSSASASASTGCRWRSSSPPRACKVLAPAAILERLAQPARPAERRPARRPGSASRPCARRSAGATTCSTRRRGRLFAQLGVFVGGWTLEAAEAVVRAGRARQPRGAGGPEPRHRGGRSLRDARDGPRVRARAAGRRRRRSRPPAAATPRPSPRWPRGRGAAAHAATSAAWLDCVLDAERENIRAAVGFAAGRGRRRHRAAACAADLALLDHARQHDRAAARSSTIALARGDGPPELRLSRAQRRRRARGRAGRLRRRRASSSRRAWRSRSGSRRRLGRARLPQPGQPRDVRRRPRRGAPALRGAGAVIYREVGDDRSLSLIIQNLGHRAQRRRPATSGRRAARARASCWPPGRRPRAPVLDHCARSRARSWPARPRARDGARSAQGEPRPVGATLGDRPGILECLETLGRPPAEARDPGAQLIGAAMRRARAAGRHAPARRGRLGARGEAALRDALGRTPGRRGAAWPEPAFAAAVRVREGCGRLRGSSGAAFKARRAWQDGDRDGSEAGPRRSGDSARLAATRTTSDQRAGDREQSRGRRTRSRARPGRAPRRPKPHDSTESSTPNARPWRRSGTRRWSSTRSLTTEQAVGRAGDREAQQREAEAGRERGAEPARPPSAPSSADEVASAQARLAAARRRRAASRRSARARRRLVSRAKPAWPAPRSCWASTSSADVDHRRGERDRCRAGHEPADRTERGTTACRCRQRRALSARRRPRGGSARTWPRRASEAARRPRR